MRVDTGVDAEGVLGFSVSLEGPRYDADGASTIARNRILGRASTIIASVDLDRHALPRFSRFFQTLP